MTILKILKSYPALFAWAFLCSLPPLFYFYVGEEGACTLTSLEMWQYREFRHVIMYGAPGLLRPPLFNYTIMSVVMLTGWENILLASRIVTAISTLATGVMLAWLAMQLWRDRTIALTAGILYLVTADVMLYRGWLAYADPLYSMFIVFSIALVWVACIRASYQFLLVSVLLAFAAFLTKALTVYLFLGISMGIFLTDVNYRKFLLSPRAFGIYGLGVLLPFFWWKFGSDVPGEDISMLQEIRGKLVTPKISQYLIRLFIYPLEYLGRLLPSTFFIGYFLLYRRALVLQEPAVRMALLIALLNYLPYLIAPEGGIRYVLPTYPFVVLAAAYLVVQKGSPFHVKKWIFWMLLIGTLCKFIAFPYYQKIYRGENYKLMASEILANYGDYPLYITNVSSVGLSVAANIDVMRINKPVITFPPADFKDGIVIAYSSNDVSGKLLKIIQIGGKDRVYLICRGNACGVSK